MNNVSETWQKELTKGNQHFLEQSRNQKVLHSETPVTQKKDHYNVRNYMKFNQRNSQKGKERKEKTTH